MNLTLHFDGACEPRNPGGVATAGWIVTSGGQTLASGAQFITEGRGATNNVAEYHAIGFGLKWIVENIDQFRSRGVALSVYGDSQLVVNQVQLSWQCNKEHLRLLRDRCRQLIEIIRKAGVTVAIGWVPREQNEAADALSRRAYEEHTGRKFPERRRAG